jgi:SPP1 gp7 family putative phage head morphogenesis protein
MTLKGLIFESVVTNDCFGLRVRPPFKFPTLFASPIPSQQFRFDTDAAKIEKFLAWLDEMIQEGIFEIRNGQYWFRPFLLEGYSRGIAWAQSNVKKAEAAMRRAGITPPLGLDMSTVMVLQGKQHVEALQSLYTRAFQDLKGITAAMDAAISRELADGFLAGENPRKIAKRLTDRVDKIGKHRATLLARTEIIRAHHVATINRYEDLEIETVVVQAEWLATKDGRVCAICASRNGKIFTLEQVRAMIPVHPQCRCTTIANFDFND